jgi:hypothetical protein
MAHQRTRLPRGVAGLSQREEEILIAVSTYRYLHVEQVTRLFFSPSSRNYAGEYLRHLTQTGYLTRFPLPKAKPGNPLLLYSVTRKGMRYRQSLGHDLYGWTRPPQYPTYQHLSHSIAVNDVLIAAVLLTKHHSAIALADLRTEWMLKHTPLVVHQPQQPAIHVVPDAWCDFRLSVQGQTIQYPLLLELDRGSEDQSQLRRKIHNLLIAVLSDAYIQQFGTSHVTIAFATTAGAKRAASLKAWIEKELTAMQRQHEADLFLIADITDVVTTPDSLFLGPLWVCPFHTDRYSLLSQ